VNRKPNCSCSVCSTEIYRRPIQIEAGPVFCSSKCHGSTTRRPPGKCANCEAEISGKRTYCSKSCATHSKIGLKYNKGNPALYYSLKLRVDLAEARGGSCEICRNDNFAILQVHHLIRRCDGGGDEHSNLQLLCANCHAEQHRGKFTFDMWKEKKE
jgi:5-methylcytosine-specific restriction endonuclease McrA